MGSERSLEEKILGILGASPKSTKVIAKRVGSTETQVRIILMDMYEEGRVCKEEVQIEGSDRISIEWSAG